MTASRGAAVGFHDVFDVSPAPVIAGRTSTGAACVEPARRRWTLLGVTVSVLVLTGLAWGAHSLLSRVDDPLSGAVRNQGWLDVLAPINELGSEQRGAVLAVIVGLALWRWCRTLSLVVPAAVLGSVALNVAVKLVVDRPRPPSPATGTALASFPSGHVLHAVVLLGLAPLVVAVLGGRPAFRRVTAALAAVGVLGVAAMRIHLGAHWPTDVIGSVLMGTLVLAVVAKVAREHRLCDEGASCGSGGDPSSRGVAS